MKKTLNILIIIAGLMTFSATAFALPTVNGTYVPGTEWDNLALPSAGPYPYYLDVADPNEGGITDAYDISRVVLLQELTGVSGDATPANDGIYLLIETFAKPSLVDEDPGGNIPLISMSGDFNGDGVIDIQLIHYNFLDPTDPSKDVVEVCLGAGACLAGFGTELSGAGGAYARDDVLEYFIPTGSFGTPASPFPTSFIGILTYDAGGDKPDDKVIGTLIPEPSTMFLMGAGLLGLLGLGRFRK